MRQTKATEMMNLMCMKGMCMCCCMSYFATPKPKKKYTPESEYTIRRFQDQKNEISTDESGRPDGLFFYYSDTDTDLFCYASGSVKFP